jgi:PmbA protein
VRAIAASAAAAALIADADEFAAPPEPEDGAAAEIEGLHDARLAAWDTEGKIELAKAVERSARAADERVVAVETTVYVDEEAEVALASSRGTEGAWRFTACYAFLQAIAAQGSDRQTGLGFGLGRSPAALDAEEIGREAAERAVSLLAARKPGSRTCPVVLDPTVAASFIGFIGATLCADSVQRGRSPFADQLGEAIAASALTVIDDGLDPAGFASAPLDAEGAPRGRTPLIEDGTLRAYLHDAYTARRAGER